jgi:hypothetical protein
MKWFDEKKLCWCVVGIVGITFVGGDSANAEFVFGEPTKVLNVNSAFSDGSPQISRDGLELYMSSRRDGGISKIWISKRASLIDAWSTPTQLDAPVNPAATQNFPSLSADGLELYFADGENGTPDPTGYGDSDIWVLERASKCDPWGAPQNLGSMINSVHGESTPCISADGLELYFASNVPDHPQNSEIRVSSRLSKDDPWGQPVTLNTNVNSNQYEYTPFISTDGLSLFFSRGYFTSHVHVCTRITTSDPWGRAFFFTAVNSGNTNDVWGGTGNAEYHACFSHEDSLVYFTRSSNVLATDYNIWQVEATPVVDFNNDEAVDILDVYELLEHWETTDNSLYDIAPFPLGDGIVDGKDLMVLAKHLGEIVE